MMRVNGAKMIPAMIPALKHQSLRFIAVISHGKLHLCPLVFPQSEPDWLLLDSAVVRLHAFGVGGASSAVWRRGPLSGLEIDEGHHATARRSQNGRSGGRRRIGIKPQMIGS